MMRKLAMTVFAFVFCVGFIVAAEVKGKIEKVDIEGKTLTLKDGKKTHTVKVMAETKIVDADGKELKEGLKADGFKEGAEVVVTTDGKGKKLVTKEIKLSK